MRCQQDKAGFSQVELVIVIAVIGIVAAIAVPRLSQGSDSDGEAALRDDLAVLRHAINLYAATHERAYPGPDSATFTAQLSGRTDAGGSTVRTPGVDEVFGPFLLQFPECPVGENAGSAAVRIDDRESPPRINPAGGEGWVYNPTTGEILANTMMADSAGMPFSSY